ncbi:MAG TPA: hypothetical protein VNI79_07235 [Sphingomicrobium sp.]|nr:hypothetical protein [Sphingomicrobium sp.]
MRLLIPVTALLLSACGSNPKPPLAQPIAPEPRERGALIGLNASELIARFGTPRLQIREGVGTKIQFAAPGCVLDVYLYPPGSGPGLATATHVDTRNRDGRSTDQASCIALLASPR